GSERQVRSGGGTQAGGDGLELGDEIPHRAGWTIHPALVEQAANTANTLAGIHRLAIDVLEHLERGARHRLRTAQHALSGLGERGDGAERLIELVRNAAGHFLERRYACNRHQSLDEDVRVQSGLARSLRTMGLTHFSCFRVLAVRTPRGGAAHTSRRLPQGRYPGTREIPG